MFAIADHSSGEDAQASSAAAGLASSAHNQIDDEVAVVRIAQAIRELRRVRRDEFGLAVGEPAWDMLIELYYRDSTGASTTATQLKEAAFVPHSSADRWLKHLERERFVRARGHPTDIQTEFVELTNVAREALERYLVQVRAVAVQQSAAARNTS